MKNRGLPTADDNQGMAQSARSPSGVGTGHSSPLPRGEANEQGEDFHNGGRDITHKHTERHATRNSPRTHRADAECALKWSAEQEDVECEHARAVVPAVHVHDQEESDDVLPPFHQKGSDKRREPVGGQLIVPGHRDSRGRKTSASMETPLIRNSSLWAWMTRVQKHDGHTLKRREAISLPEQ